MLPQVRFARILPSAALRSVGASAPAVTTPTTTLFAALPQTQPLDHLGKIWLSEDAEVANERGQKLAVEKLIGGTRWSAS